MREGLGTTLTAMPSSRRTLPSLLLCAALLAGCATPDRDPRLQPGRSNEAEVVALYGQPGRVWPEADGGRTLEYSGQPMGRHTWMVTLDAAGRLVGVIDALSPAGRARVQPGMTPEQVSEASALVQAAIVGTYFHRNGDVSLPLDVERIRAFMMKVIAI